jgi:MFS family permease
MATAEKLGFRETLGVLRGPFRRYMIGEAISMTGTWMQMMAQGWVMATLTTSAFALGMLTFVGALPGIFLAMPAGSLADRFDKRVILQICQAAQILGACAVGFLVHSGHLQLWHMLVVGLLLGIVTAVEMPAASAIVPELVDKKDIFRAIAFDRATFHGTRLIGPALAGICVAKLGAASAFFINAFTFVALMIALASLPPRPLGTAEEEEARHGGFKEGLAYVRSDAPTLGMISLIAITTTLIFPLLMVLMPIYTKHILHVGPEAFGVLMGLSGVGSLVGTIGLLTVAPGQRPRRMAIAAAIITVALFLVSQATTLWVAAGSVAFLTVGISTLVGLANTTVQERAPDYIRGRVSAVAGLAFFGIMPIAAIGISSLVDLLGMRTVMASNAVTFGLGAAYILSTQARKACEGCAPAPSAPAEAVPAEG